MFPLSSASNRSTSSRGSAQTILDQAPGLKDTIERTIAKVVKSLQTMAGMTTTIEGMFSGFVTGHVKEVITSHGPDTAAAILESHDLRLPMVMILDPTLVHAMVELLCGGNGIEPPPSEPRPVTAIDLQFAQILFSVYASAVQSEWAGQGFTGMRATKVDGGLPTDCLGTATDVAIVKMTIGAFGVHGVVSLVLSKDVLSRFQGDGEVQIEMEPSDPTWSGQLRKEVGQAVVSLDAYLDMKGLTLSSLATLQVGQILTLPAETGNRVSLVCDDKVLYRGELGQADDLYSIRIGDFVLAAPKSTAVQPRVARSPLYDLSKA